MASPSSGKFDDSNFKCNEYFTIKVDTNERMNETNEKLHPNFSTFLSLFS